MNGFVAWSSRCGGGDTFWNKSHEHAWYEYNVPCIESMLPKFKMTTTSKNDAVFRLN